MEKSLLYPVINRYRTDEKLDGLWNFKFDPASNGETKGWHQGFSDGIKMPVPASFNDFFTDKDAREYTGDFWYARKFFVSDYLKDKDIQLRFGAATHRAVVYVNGQKIRSHEGGFLPFTAEVTSAVKFGEENTVAVKINNELHRDALPAGDTATLKNGKKWRNHFLTFTITQALTAVFIYYRFPNKEFMIIQPLTISVMNPLRFTIRFRLIPATGFA